jgi:hypothetical protein
MVWAASAAAAVCLCGIGAWAYTSPYSYVSLDVHPSIEFTLHRFDRVLTVTAVNDDAQEIVGELVLQNLNHKTIDTAIAKAVQELTDKGYPRECIDNYKAVGGTPWLDFHHTVFGQIIEGTEVLEDIAAVRCGMNDKPMHDVIIETVEVSE